MASEIVTPAEQNSFLGIALRLCATAAFAIMAVLIKLAHEAGANTPEIVFYRNLFALPVLLVWMSATGTLGAWRTRRPGVHLARGVLGLTAMSLSFAALSLLPLAEATTLSFVAPLFAVALSALILGEAVRRYRWSAVAVGFLGVLIVTQPGGGTLSLLGLAMALLAAGAVGFVTITIREMSRTESTQTMVLWFTGFALVASSLALPFFGQRHDGLGWALLAAVGLCGGIGQICLTGSLRAAPVAVVVPFDYMSLLWAVLFGWLIWDTHPQATTWLGAAIIVASGLYTLYREHKLGREKPRPEPL